MTDPRPHPSRRGVNEGKTLLILVFIHPHTTNLRSLAQKGVARSPFTHSRVRSEVRNGANH